MALSRKRKLTYSPLSLLSGKRKCLARGNDLNGRLSPHENRMFALKKHVRFASNYNGSLKITEQFIDILRADLDKPHMWYSRDERHNILDECEETIKDFQNGNLDQTSNFTSISLYCRRDPSQEASEFLESAELRIPVNARGLEWGWASVATAGNKKNHVRELLKIQEHVKSLNSAMRDRVLASRSLKSSRPGRVMARLIGECDARNAKSDIET